MRSQLTTKLGLSSLLVLLCSSCINSTSEEPSKAADNRKNQADYDEEQDRQVEVKQQAGGWTNWWSYEGVSGPQYWRLNKRWRLCTEGHKQSPVDIRTSQLVFDHLLPPIQLTWLPAGSNLAALEEEQQLHQAANKPPQQQQQPSQHPNRPIRVQLINSGRGVEVWFEATTSRPSLRSVRSLADQDQLILWQGPLSYAYKLYKLELHSTSSANGAQPASEHWIDGRALDAELQLHFYNKHLAKSAQHALRLLEPGPSIDPAGALPLADDSRPNLFAVISVFLLRQQGAADNQSHEYKPLDFVIDNLAAIQNQGNAVELELDKRRLESLVPETRQYVTYQGSLNRPPCSEGVDWILVNRALRIESSKFELLFNSQGGGQLNTNQDNARPVMPLNRRLLRTTIDDLEHLATGRLEPNHVRKQTCRPLAHADAKEPAKEEPTGEANCTGSSAAKQGAQLELNGAIGPRQCSMKPNYVYQLRQHYARLSE